MMIANNIYTPYNSYTIYHGVNLCKEYVQYAIKKNLWKNLEKTKEINLDMIGNVRSADMKNSQDHIILRTKKKFIRDMVNGQKEIGNLLTTESERTMKKILKNILKDIRNIMKKQDTNKNTKKNIVKIIEKRSVPKASYATMLIEVILLDQPSVLFVMLKQKLKRIMQTMQNHWKLYGFVENVTWRFTEGFMILQPERLSEKTPKGEATVRTKEETFGEKPEAVFPPVY